MDSTILSFLAAPFAASLILTGIHAYLGVHVVERGVIFVDLSLAQIAALGATLALVVRSRGPRRAFLARLLGEPRIHAGRRGHLRDRAHAPVEGPAGGDHRHLYAVASAASILAMSKAPSRDRAPQGMLVGNILAVSWPEVFKTAALYAAVGAFHYAFRKQFLAISVHHDQPERTGLHVRWWDFLFYASFGFVVTSSVSIAGVLLVFCYLIVPSVAAMLYSTRIGVRLAIGWTMGTIVSGVGVYLSLVLDFPTGATIVCTFGVALLLMAVARPFILRQPA